MSDEQLMDGNVASETYKFLNALLDDYTACKTELARGGILKAYRMLLDRASGDHLKQIEKTVRLEKELADTKAKLPKTKEEITKILHEAGFHELEECEGGTWHHGLPSPELTPKEYAELYRRLYGEMTKGDEKKLDKEIQKLEDKKVEEEIAQIKASEQILEDKKLEESKETELDETKKMTPEEFFDIDTSSEASKEDIKPEEAESKKARKPKKATVKKTQKRRPKNLYSGK